MLLNPVKATAVRPTVLNSFFKYPVLFLIFAALLFCGCGQSGRFQPLSYFPVNTGLTWIYDGEIRKMEVADVTREVGDKMVTLAYYDTLDVMVWQEKYNLIKNQIYLQSFEPRTNLLPQISFEPAIPFAPLSARVGQRTVLKSIEVQTDSLRSSTEVQVEYTIEAIEDVTVPAGTFQKCIKMKIHVIYPQTAYRPYFIGEQYWWFAPSIGPVKYDLPSAYGELVETRVNRNRGARPAF